MSQPQPALAVDPSMIGHLVPDEPRHPDGAPMLPEAKLIVEVLMEAHRALRLHGRVTTYPERAISLMVEELGEAAREINIATSPRTDPRERPQGIQRARMELLQLAAYALIQIQNIDNQKLLVGRSLNP